MNIQRLLIRSLPMLAASALLITGCRRQDDEDNDTSAAADNAFADAMYSDVTNITDEAGRTGSLSNYRISDSEGILTGCATITFDSLQPSDLDTMTIDFGTTNCTGNDGRNRRGKIIVNYTGRYRDIGYTHNISFDNYFVNDNQILGTKTVTNTGLNTAGNLVYNITVNGEIARANNGGTITWVAQRQREWLQGESTLVWSDDIYSITGSSTGTNAAGNTFSTQITSPLIRNMSVGCRRHFVQGVVEISPSNRPMRTVDFGTGTCDNIATVTINNNTYTIQLQ
jgi:hypothetical protein